MKKLSLIALLAASFVGAQAFADEPEAKAETTTVEVEVNVETTSNEVETERATEAEATPVACNEEKKSEEKAELSLA